MKLETIEPGDRFGVHAVFTPTTQAKVNFVERDATLNNILVDALETPGKQIVVYGDSGSGKSTLLKNKLEQLYPDHIVTRCHTSTTFEQILLDGFDQLEKFYDLSHKSTTTGEVTTSFGTELKAIRSAINLRLTEASEVIQQRILPPQLTPQRLGEFIGSLGLCWVLEDFHKIESIHKKPLAQALKLFADLGSTHVSLRIIAIGATGTAREVVEYDPDMRNRICELRVPLMNDKELREILRQGEKLLNVDFGNISDQIVQYSAGLGSVCHQLALNICLGREIRFTLVTPITFNRSDIERALTRYVEESSDTVKSAFERALRRHRVRVFDNCRLVLEGLSSGPITGMRYDEILSEIRRREPKYHASNLTKYLRALESSERGGIIASNLERVYRFSDPLHYAYAQALFHSSAADLKERPASAEWDFTLYDTLVNRLRVRIKQDKHQLQLFGNADETGSESLIWDPVDMEADKKLDAETE